MKIWIPASEYRNLTSQYHKKSPYETGGVIAGYYSANYKDAVITKILPPGPDAIHHRSSYTPDYRWDKEAIGIHYDKTDGFEYYLGDWHTHPSCRAMLSQTDKQALKCIARYPYNYTDHPIMLIVGEKQNRLQVSGWRIKKKAPRWRGWDYLTCALISY